MWASSDRRGRLPGVLRTADLVVVHLLAIILVIAAIAKAASDRNPTHGWIPLELVVGLEAAAAFLLAFRRDQRITRLAVSGLFVVLAGFALAGIIQGRASCDCFGDVAAPPLWLFVFDAAAAAWLLASAAVMAGQRSLEERHALAPPPQSSHVSRHQSRAALTLAVVAAVGAIGTGISWLVHRDDPARRLRIDRSELNLGTIWLQESLDHTLHITNTSSREITISSLAASCQCTKIEPAAIRLAPYETRSIRLGIDLFKIARENWHANGWPLNVQLLARTNNLTGAQPSWRVTGEIKSPFTAIPKPNPESLALFRIAPAATVTFDLQLKPGIQVVRALPDHQCISCRVEEKGSDQTPTIVMQIDPSKCNAGMFLARAALDLGDAEGNVLPSLPLALPVYVQASVVLDPSVLLLVQRNASTVHLRSAHSEPFRIVRIITCDGVSAELLRNDEEYAIERIVTVTATAVDNTLSLVPLHIDVRTKDSELTERLTLQVQRPTHL